ncbi:MAG: His-Xaa-Ser system radical SAM maturase HxsB [Candidatus Nanoarchaeia archaeon]
MANLYLNKKFYHKDAIEEGLKDFSEIAKGTILDNEYNIELQPFKKISNLEEEFSNYVLGLMKNRGLDMEKTPETFLGEGVSEEDEAQTEIDKEYIKNHCRSKKMGEQYLITAETGDWVFLNKNEYLLFTQNRAEEDEGLFKKLLNNNILIDKNNLTHSIETYKNKKDFICQGTSLHIVVLTLRCDIKCQYCHASSKPLNKTEYDMDKETAKKVVDRIFESPSTHITIEFQGGEPLLNFDVLKEIVEYAREKNKSHKKTLKFTVVTNLVNMDSEKLNYLTENKINICTSLDGPRELHNKTRQCYDNVINWIKEIKKLHDAGKVSGPPHALLTVARAHLSYPKEIIEEYIEQGYDRIHLRAINQLGDARNKLDEIYYSIEEFLDFWRKAMDYILEKNRNGQYFVERKTKIILKKLYNKHDPNFLDLRSPCGAVIGQLLYNHNGKIYTCDEGRMLGEDDLFCIGTVDQNYSEFTTNSTSCAIIAASVNDTHYCDKCVYKPFCGLCPVLNYATSGSLVCNVPSSDWCKLHYAQFEYVFQKLREPENKKVFDSWVKDQY